VYANIFYPSLSKLRGPFRLLRLFNLFYSFFEGRQLEPSSKILNQVLYRSKTCCIELFLKPNNVNGELACVFSAGANRNLEGNGHGGEVLINEGFDVLLFKINNDDWFQQLPPSIWKHIEKSLAKHLYVRRVGTGTSMGGYAAIAFSKLLNLETVLAYSPQYRIDSNFDQRWAEFSKNIIWRYRITFDSINRNCKYLIVFDPCGADGLQVNYLKEIIPSPNLMLWSISHSGHCATRFLHELNQLKLVTVQALKRLSFQGISLQRKSNSIQYIINLALSLEKRNQLKRSQYVLEFGINKHKITNLDHEIFKRLENIKNTIS
jgi:phosphotransferase system IIB component